MSTSDFSPFVFERPLAPDELPGRKEEVTYLLDAAKQSRFVRVVAPRRFGKTSVLRRVLSDAQEKGMVGVYVDFGGIATVNDVVVKIQSAYAEQIPEKRRQALQRDLETLGMELGPGGIKFSMSRSPQQFEPVQALELLLDRPVKVLADKKKPLVVVFDEFQEVLRVEHIPQLLRSKIQHHQGVSYIFSGSEPGMMRALFQDKTQPLYNQAVPFSLGRLDNAVLAPYIHDKFEATGKSAGEMVAQLLYLTAGHPQRSMLLAHALWEATPSKATAGMEELIAAIRWVMAVTAQEFQEKWRRLTISEKRVCKALRSEMGSLYSTKVLEAFDLAKGSAQHAVKALLDRGEIEDTGEAFQIVDPIFMLWLMPPNITTGPSPVGPPQLALNTQSGHFYSSAGIPFSPLPLED